LASLAQRRRVEPEELLAQIQPLRAALLQVRSRRQRPVTDDKILSDWNGLAICGLAVAGRLLPDEEMTRRAADAAEFVLARMHPDGAPLRHAWRRGVARVEAFLGDYAFMIRGLLELHDSTGESRWLSAAVLLAEEQERRLGDPIGGYFVAAASDEVPFRSKEIFDGALPSGNGIAIQNLLRLAAASGEERWLERADKAIGAFSAVLEQRPETVKTLLVAAHRFQQMGTYERRAVGAISSDLEDESLQKVSPVLAIGLADEQGWQPFRLELQIVEGWHVNAPGGDESSPHLNLIGQDMEIRGLRWPEPEWLRLPGSLEAVPAYSGLLQIYGQLRAASPASARLSVEFQPCDERRCLPAARSDLRLDAAVDLSADSGD